jgi:colanic acid/amylovoran biosynthesis glycosyltransferase
MKIAFIVTGFPALSETFVLNQITGLIDRGHEVDIYAGRKGQIDRVHPDVEHYRLLERAYYPRIPRNFLLHKAKGAALFMQCMTKGPVIALHSLSTFGYRQLAACLVLARGLRALLRRRSYDIIHCHFGPNGVKGIFYREKGLLDGKLLTTFHGYDVSTYPRRYGSACYKPLFEQGDFFTANTTYTAERMMQLGCPKHRIVKLPVGVDLGRFTFAEHTLKQGEEVRVLTIGRLLEVKGIEYGIRAIAQVAADYPNIRYDIVGEGRLRKRLVRLAQSLGIAERIRFHGAQTQDRVLELYAQAHIFMLPSVVAKSGAQEGQGLVLLEAQAAGIPVISTRVGGIPETVLDGQSGFLVPQRDANALADRLSYLIAHADQWPRMGRAGRDYVERHYDLANLNDRLVEIYRALLAGTIPSTCDAPQRIGGA